MERNGVLRYGKPVEIVSGSGQTPLNSSAYLCSPSDRVLKVEPLLKFAHRWNPDGTVDSICYRRIAIVATVRIESKLLECEQQHVCNPVFVERFNRTMPRSSETVEDFQDRHNRDARTAHPTRQ
jgi:hypothetical protein